jgi:dipeptidyl aminopeptidase/acylaminoacyl peptidase
MLRNHRLCSLSIFVFTYLVLSPLAVAADFTLEQVLSSPFPTGLVAAQASPRVAWVFDSKGARNVWIADGPDFEARQITRWVADDGQPIASLRITADGRTVVFARGSEANESGRIADPSNGIAARQQQVWAVDVASGASRLLGVMGCPEEDCEDIQISPDGQFVVWATKKQLWIAPVSGALAARQLTDLRGDNSDPKWSPDGRQIVFQSNRGDHSFIVVYDLGSDSVRYLSPSVDRDALPRWSSDGKKIAFIRTPGVADKLPLIPQRPKPWSILVGNVATGQAKEIWRSGSKPDDSFPELTANASFLFPANDRLVFASEQDGRNHLYTIPANGGPATLLTAGAFDVEDVTLSTDRHSVIYSSNQDDIDRRHLWRVNVDGGTPQAITRGETLEWTPVETGQGNYIVCLGSTATSPAMPYRITPQGREMLAKSALPATFPSSQLVTPKQVIFKSEDGLEIHGQLFAPKNTGPRTPALIFMHGGPVRQMMLGFHYMNYYHNAYAMNQYLASHGYIVLSVNYRLGIMYGRAFREAPNSCWRGAAEYKDILAARRYLQGLPNVDQSKVGLWGGSYGGYLTALGLARNSDLFAAGVDFHGVHDWSVFLPHWENQPGAPDLKDAQQLAFDSSPDSAVSHWKSPVLLIHGDDDRNVPFNQTVDLAQRLRENHVDFEELIFPDEIHGFLMWKTWVTAYGATADFFDRKLTQAAAQRAGR